VRPGKEDTLLFSGRWENHNPLLLTYLFEVLMHVLAFNSSPRKNGNTQQLLEAVGNELQKESITVEHICIGGKLLRGCTACGGCSKHKGRCAFDDDPMNEWISKMTTADGILLGSPTYFATVNTEMKALIDRAGFVLKRIGGLRLKVGAPVVVARRGGAMQTYNTLMAFFGINEMIVPSSIYWNMGYGLMPGDVLSDEEGMETMRQLGRNMAFVLKKVRN
jgi:multimeric flavodoxin WrbA